MKKVILLLSLFCTATLAVKAQDTVKTTSDAPLVFTGSVDTYWKYDFSKHQNIQTYFGSDQNSVSIGMVDLGLKKKVGKAAFVGEISFGPRSDQSLPTGSGGYHIQNLYVSYDVTSQLNFTAGYMSTFVGYEVISPVGNFNYSTSYLFGAGPFQNAGFKATYAFSDKFSLMAGIFNNQWNYYTSLNGAGDNFGDVSTFGAQLMVAPVKGWTAYVNLLTGSYAGTVLDLTTTYQITDAFKLGLNGAIKSGSGATNYSGAAIYPQIAVSKAVTFGLREEYFKVKSSAAGSDLGIAPGNSVLASTLTANIKSGPLTFMPEIRIDDTKQATAFVKSDGTTLTKSATQFLLAAVYAF